MRDTHDRNFGGSLHLINPKDIDDVRLVQRICVGDTKAFDLLYRAYFPRLARFLDRVVHGAPLLEEVINDTMLVVWNKAHTYNFSSKVSTWIFAIAYRKALKAIKYADQPEEYDFDQCKNESEIAPEQAIMRIQASKLLAAALDSLPLDQRVTVQLTYFHGMGYAEIADIMTCPVNTVKTRMFHARRRLKIMLADKLE